MARLLRRARPSLSRARRCLRRFAPLSIEPRLTMEFSDRLSNLRQLIAPGTRPPADDERLLQLYWNRAELKKELSRLQDERHKLLEQLKNHEATFVRHSEQLLHLEEFLGNPETGAHALVYFQLRSLW